MADLFSSSGQQNITGADGSDPEQSSAASERPLADRIRPARLAEVVGQAHLLAPGAPIAQMAGSGKLSSLIFWGPPGVGKTTLARLLCDAIFKQKPPAFEALSAIISGVGDLRKVFDRAEQRHRIGQHTVLFVDEIHRFNRAQQDSFLGPMESGLITLIGATTENPSFELNGALLSRARVYTLKSLDASALETLIGRAEKHMTRKLPLDEEARALMIRMADGDGRFLLNMAEQLFNHAAVHEDKDSSETGADVKFDREALQVFVQQRPALYDKSQEGHYNLASALQKSIRGSDVDAALYWTARMILGGEDPKFILRRLIVIASEDIGNADPHALPMAMAARDAMEVLGLPEGEIPLAQLVTYLATAPKSNRSYAAWKMAKSFAKKSGSPMPPRHAVNAPTRLMKEQGYSDGYVYDHDTPNAFAGLSYFPEGLEREVFYTPRKIGHEREIEKRLAWWNAHRKP